MDVKGHIPQIKRLEGCEGSKRFSEGSCTLWRYVIGTAKPKRDFINRCQKSRSSIQTLPS